MDKDDDGNYVLKVDFADARFALAAGTTAVLTVSTTNPTTTNTNGTIENTAYVTPTSQTFTDVGSNGIDVPEGEEDGEEVVDYQHSVESKAQVPVTYASGTTSSKGVTELEETGETTNNSVTSSTTTQALELTDDSSTFRYTLTVNNGSSAINSLTLWDSLPEEGDADVITGALRYSQFKVSLAGEPSFTVTVTDGATTYNLVAGTDYTIQYTSDTSAETDLTSNEVTWTNEPDENTRAFRIIFHFGEEGCQFDSLPANATVTVTFNAVIDGDADPGATAWNSFSYSYTTSTSDTEITATPLQVGVQVPYVPILVKQVQDVDGSTVTMEKDTEYTFLIYQGSELEDVDTSDVQALLDALSKNNRTFTVVTLKVEAGQGTASMTLENLHAYTLTKQGDTYIYSENTESEWTWVDYGYYTIVELTQDVTYPFFTWSSGSSTAYENSYMFRYRNNTNVTLTCANRVDSYELPSAGGTGTRRFLFLGLFLCSLAALALYGKRRWIL